MLDISSSNSTFELKKHQNENFHWHHSFSLKYSIINTDILFSMLCVLNGIHQAGVFSPTHLLPLYHFKQLTWWQKELFAYCLQVSWYSVSKFPSTLSVNIECIKHTINRRDYFVLVDGTIIFTITSAVAGIPEWLLVGRMHYVLSKYSNSLLWISKQMQLK